MSSKPLTIVRAIVHSFQLYVKCPKCQKGTLNADFEHPETDLVVDALAHVCSECGHFEILENLQFPKLEKEEVENFQLMWDPDSGLFAGTFIINNISQVYVFMMDENSEFILISLNDQSKRLPKSVLKNKKYEWKMYQPSKLGVSAADLANIFVVNEDASGTCSAIDYSQLAEIDPL